jgi:pimeloyl-ACP methyl ester carboxylesterase
MILWGEQDSALEAGLADEALKYCTNASLVRIEDATHWLHHEQPVRVGKLLGDFFALDLAPVGV